MNDNIIKYAFDQLTDKPVFINDAANGINCNCKCAKCGERLEAIQGKTNEWHFRHYNRSNCNGGQETVIHKYAKQIIVESLQITLPKYGKIAYTEANAEKELNSIRPDVTAIYNEQKIYFEIAVKHFNEPEKNTFLINGKHKSVEIDLSTLPLISSPTLIANAVLNEITNKRIIFWESTPVINYQVQDDKDNWWTNPFVILGFIACSFLGYKWVTSKINTKK